MQNNTSNELIIARGVSKSVSKSKGQPITKLFFDADTTQRVIDQLVAALNSQSDGVSLTILEGEGAKGPFAMIGASGLEARADQPARGQQKAYTAPPSQAGKPSYTPRTPAAVGGYQPKTPGYKGRG